MADTYHVKRYEGDDIYSWAVFKNLPPEKRKETILFYPDKPVMDGMSRKEALYQKSKLMERKD